MEQYKKAIAMVLGAGVLVYAVDFIATSPNQAELDRREYCEMVKLGKETNNKLGWPDFRHNYSSVCPTE